MSKLILGKHRAGLTLSLGCLLSVPLQIPAAPVGSPAPAWSLVDVHGRTLRSTNFAGKVVVINFFATWCVPCVWEIPDFVALQNKYWREGLVVVGVGVRQLPSELLPFMNANTINYPVCPSVDSILWDFTLLPAGAIPLTAIIDRDNKLVGLHTYYHTKAFYENALQPLLFAPTPPTLTLKRSGANMMISWPSSATNFVLETKASYSTEATWAPMTNALVGITNGLRTVAVPTSGSSGFFRLKAP